MLPMRVDGFEVEYFNDEGKWLDAAYFDIEVRRHKTDPKRPCMADVVARIRGEYACGGQACMPGLRFDGSNFSGYCIVRHVGSLTFEPDPTDCRLIRLEKL